VCANKGRRPLANLDGAFVVAVAARLEEGTVIDLAVEALRRRSAPESRVDLCTPLTERRDALREERDNLERALARATPNLLDRVLALLDAKQTELDAAEAALAAATSAPAPIDAATLTPEALRARVADRVRRLRSAFAEDVLEGPIVATPIEVNGEMRFLLRGTLRTAPPHLVARAAIQGGATTVNSDGVKKVGDPKGIFAELEAALVVEVVG
jgi:hypothetical protein